VEEGANYRDASPYQGEAEPPQPPPLQDLDTEEDKEVQSGVNAIKIRKQSTHQAVKEPLFSEKTHKTKEPQVGRHGSAPPLHPNTLKKQKGMSRKGRKAWKNRNRESLPRTKLQSKPGTRATERPAPGQEQRKTK
jgi:hypothetical protein